MEPKSDPSTAICEHCGHPITEIPVPSELDALEPPALEPPPLFGIRTPGGRVVYKVNLN